MRPFIRKSAVIRIDQEFYPRASYIDFSGHLFRIAEVT